MAGEVERLQELVDKYDNIVFFGGAGVSTDQKHCHNTGPHKHIHHFRPNCLFVLSFYSVFILYFHILKFPVIWSIFTIILS